ncbi:MAG: FliI/YscN family ATPase [Armatimonadetes bacterium]|nr:FliI/YscN family ATPase [Armatimonadota bacterium]
MLIPDLSAPLHRLRSAPLLSLHGRVARVTGLLIESVGPAANLGDLCQIENARTGHAALAEVVGFQENRLLLMALGEMREIGPGCRVSRRSRDGGPAVPVGEGLLGRVVDALGRPLDRLGPLSAADHYPLCGAPPDSLRRTPIDQPLPLGIRAIDGLLTLGRGQRIGIFAGSGVGKSTLLGAIARNAAADVNVVALIGERRREVREFIERDLGPAGLARSVVVVATSDQPAVLRLKGAQAASSIAEYFRDQGAHVLLMMDSLTRCAWAQREVGLAAGEPPTTRGYTPSVFAMLPRLVERAGTAERGSITGLYTVLVEGDDMNEPVADTARGLLDGHIVLSRRLAARNHYPAVEVLESVSRLFPQITSPEHQQWAGEFRDLLATYRQVEDLIQVGAYAAGQNAKTDRAVARIDALLAFLRQGRDEASAFATSLEHLHQAVE